MKIFFRLAFATLVFVIFQISGSGKDGKKPDGVMLGRLLAKNPNDNPTVVISQAYGINNRGHVAGHALVGRSLENDAVHAFLSINGKMTDLGVLQGYEGGSSAFAINDSDQVVGCSATREGEYDDDEHTHAFLYENGKMKDLGTLGGSYSRAYAINNSGQIVGVATNASGDFRPFIYEAGKMRDMGDFKNFKSYSALVINDAGEIAGTASPDSGNDGDHLFYYKDGKFHDLGPTGESSATVEAVNNAGDIVGEFFVEGEGNHAFLYRGGKIMDLTRLVNPPKGKDCDATCVNNRGEVLIAVDVAREEELYYIYRNGKMLDLQKEISKTNYHADWVTGMNDAGQVICIGGTPEARESFLFDY